MKALLKRALAAAGFEVRRTSPDMPLRWIADVELIEERNVGESWRTGALHLANRHRRPDRFGLYRGGDHRLHYVAWFLDLRDLRVLELGPLEGFHSVVLDKLGIHSSVAVEGRPQNLEKCRHVKRLYRLDRTEFVLHDIEALARGAESPSFAGPFDLVFALGVLYHLQDPARGLRWMVQQAPTLFLGTHYIEREDERWYPSHLFSDCSLESGGRRYSGKRFVEKRESSAAGLSPDSVWLDEESLVRALEDAGFSTISVLGKDLLAQFPHITILAERTSE